MRAIFIALALLVFFHPLWAAVEYIRIPAGGLQGALPNGSFVIIN